MVRRRAAFSRWHVASFAVGVLLGSAGLSVWTGLARALEAPASPSINIFSGNKTIIGQTIAYPSGTPMVNAIILTVPPGTEYDWHSHQAPVFGYILEGELTIDYGSKGTHVYHAGEAVLEALDWPHRPSNRGTVVTRVLAVNIAAEGIPFGVPAAGPQ
jgi:quercetin dioxygenase-like cupin family protein